MASTLSFRASGQALSSESFRLIPWFGQDTFSPRVLRAGPTGRGTVMMAFDLGLSVLVSAGHSYLEVCILADREMAGNSPAPLTGEC